MKYTTKYLKTESYEDFFAACEQAGLVADGEIITSSHNHSIVLLPNLHAPTGNILTDDDGNEYREMMPLEGFHANLRYKKPVGLESLEVEVSTPIVEWA